MGDEYVLLHSPRNGIGVKRSQDLAHWQPQGVWTLGQADWPWAQGRLSAAHVLDLRDRPEVGKYVMFFHGSTRAGVAENEPFGESSLGLAWSDDLDPLVLAVIDRFRFVIAARKPAIQVGVPIGLVVQG